MYGRLFGSTESIGSVSSGEVPEPGDLAQLARASALQAEGQGFKSPNLHRSAGRVPAVKLFDSDKGRKTSTVKVERVK